MVDRQPLHAGRVHLAPVSGQQNTFDMTMADGATEQGTALNKANLLKDATAALYGLPNTAVPDDVFAWLGRYAEHCWKRREIVSFNEVKTKITSNGYISKTNSWSTKTFSYGYSVYPKSDGSVDIANKLSITIPNSGDGAVQIAALAPCYFLAESGDVYYIPAGATGGVSTRTYTVSTIDGNNIAFRYEASPETIKASKVSISDVVFGEWEPVFSTNRAAYPDSGIQDGYEYEYLGVPFENLPTAPKIETGSYVGTGTSGASNPLTLTFGFVPKVVLFSGDSRPEMYGGRVYCFGLSSSFTSYGYCSYNRTDVTDNNARLNGNVLELYNGSSQLYQFNKLNTTYHYIAIG